MAMQTRRGTVIYRSTGAETTFRVADVDVPPVRCRPHGDGYVVAGEYVPSHELEWAAIDALSECEDAVLAERQATLLTGRRVETVA